ncbi:YybH family protein [Tundrisphaera lichenicola]|uniref:YybH family protein n=1 Tax=Tundrisphaera lichenicola TaxID=2029860 RepID=UPI003EB73F8F
MNATLLAWLVLSLPVSNGAVGEDPPSSPAQAPEQVPSDVDKEIRATLASFVESFDQGNAQSIADLFTEGGEAIDHEGVAIRGREAIKDHYAGRFADMPGDKIEGIVESIHLLAPGLARVDGRAKLVPADGSEQSWSSHSLTLAKGEAGWKIASIGEVLHEEMSRHDRLEELAWLVGEWVEESGQAVIKTSLDWSEDGNYLLRSFEVRTEGHPILKGNQRIGWDPLTRQIKSWTFDSEGGYRVGHWVRSQDQWIIKSTGVRPDGLTTSATQSMTRAGNDRIVWKSTDRTIGGVPIEDFDEIVMVRKPPEPK